MFCSWIWALTISCPPPSQLVPFGSATKMGNDMMNYHYYHDYHYYRHYYLMQWKLCPSSRKWRLSTIEQNLICVHHPHHISLFAHWRGSQQQVATLPERFCLRLQDGWKSRQRTCLREDWPHSVFSYSSGWVENRCMMLVDGGYDSSIASFSPSRPKRCISNLLFAAPVPQVTFRALADTWSTCPAAVWTSGAGSFFLPVQPAASTPWGEFVSLSVGCRSALALWSSLLVAFQKRWVQWDSVQAGCQESSLDLDLLRTICLESPGPLSSKPLFSLYSLTTHFLYFDHIFLLVCSKFFFCFIALVLFLALPVLTVLFPLISFDGLFGLLLCRATGGNVYTADRLNQWHHL